MIDQVRIYDVLQIAPPVIREQDIYGLSTRIRPIRRHAVVDAVDDIGVWGEQRIRLDFLHGQGDGFLSERAPDLLEGVQGAIVDILDQIDVRESALGVRSALFLLVSLQLAYLSK